MDLGLLGEWLQEAVGEAHQVLGVCGGVLRKSLGWRQCDHIELTVSQRSPQCLLGTWLNGAKCSYLRPPAGGTSTMSKRPCGIQIDPSKQPTSVHQILQAAEAPALLILVSFMARGIRETKETLVLPHSAPYQPTNPVCGD